MKNLDEQEYKLYIQIIQHKNPLMISKLDTELVGQLCIIIRHLHEHLERYSDKVMGIKAILNQD